MEAAAETVTIQFEGQRLEISKVRGTMVNGHECGDGEPTLKLRRDRFGWRLQCTECYQQYIEARHR